MKKILPVLFLFLSFVAKPQVAYKSYLKDAVTYREHPLDILKMSVSVKFNPHKSKVIGRVTHRFKVLQQKVDSVFFDAPSIQIKKIEMEQKELTYRTTKEGVWILFKNTLGWDEEHDMTIAYEANPRRGIYFIGWNDTVDLDINNPFGVRKQIWTQGQGIDNRHWIPMYDDMNDKFITETEITFDKNYEVLSNGVLIKKADNKDGTLTWNYRMTQPHAGYLLMLAIGKYAVKESKTAGGITLRNYYYPEWPQRQEPTYRHTEQMMNFLEKETGIPYPWTNSPYSQVMVQDFIYGAMENTTATIFGDFFNVDTRAYLDRNYVSVNCHEMTHQWFGDFITARDARDTWLQESFATYWPKQFSKVNEGTEEWDWQRRLHQQAAIEAGKKDNFPVRHTSGGTARNYPKGAAVISMLEYTLGNEQWKRALNYYLKQHAYANVETNDLKQAIQDKLGINMEWFFDEWIYKGGEPHYRVHYEDLTYANGSRGTEIAIEQIHKTDETVGYFKMPVWLEVHYTDGSKDSVLEELAQPFEVVKIDNKQNKKIAGVLFDPNSNVLKQLSFKKSFEELSWQLEKAKHLLDRYDALVALRETPIQQKRTLLIKAMSSEKHYSILSELVSQLASDSAEETAKAIDNLFAKTRYAQVRQAIVKSISAGRPNLLMLIENALTDSSYEVILTACDKAIQMGLNKETLALIEKHTQDVSGMHNAISIKRAEVLYLASKTGHTTSVNAGDCARMISRFASYRYEFRTRLLAFATLKAINFCNEEAVSSLLNAMLSSNARLAGPAAELVNHFAIQAEHKLMIKKVFHNGAFDAAQKEQIKKQASFLN